MVRIAIIGGGAAGMMVAATLAERTDWQHKPDIHIFEKNKELGTKIRISGGGRCNITTGYYKKQDLATKYTRGRDFLAHAMSQFGPRKMMQRCADHNCPIYCQDDMRCFPESNKGSDVVAMFETILHKNNVHIHFEEPILSLAHKSSDGTSKENVVENTSENTLSNQPTTTNFPSSSFTLTTSKGTCEYDFVVITTGGNAYGHTGSTGDGYSLAQSLGHTVTTLGPSLNSFLIAEEWIKECSGVSFPNAMLTADIKHLSDRTTAQPSQSINSNNTSSNHSNDTITLHGNNNILIFPGINGVNSVVENIAIPVSGPLLLTHFGISGPVTFSYSSQIPLIPISSNQPHSILCRPYADRHYDWRLSHINQTTAEHPKKQLLTLLSYHFPTRRCEAFCKAHDIDATRYLGNLTREQKQSLANLLGNGFSLTLTARRPGDEFVTAGGINTGEINPKTMQSFLCSGLFFAGEVLNIDAVTGGFNFQSCWATGRCVGMSITTY